MLGNWLFSLIIITWLTGVIHNTQVQSSLVGGRLYSPLLALSAKDLLKIDFMVSFVLGNTRTRYNLIKTMPVFVCYNKIIKQNPDIEIEILYFMLSTYRQALVSQLLTECMGIYNLKVGNTQLSQQ